MSAIENISPEQFGHHYLKHAAHTVHVKEQSVSRALGNQAMKALDALEGPHDPDNWNDHPRDIGEIS